MNMFRDVDILKSVRALLERVNILEGFLTRNNLTISGGDFSNNIHDVNLDGGEFE